jgi:hypothetical protein
VKHTQADGEKFDGVSVAGPRNKRRWLRFSLRALFVWVTILTVWLGVLSYRVQRMNAAIAAIRAAHGGISYECRYGPGRGNSSDVKPRGPAWLRSLIGDDFFVDVYTVDFRNIRVRPEPLLVLRSFPRLRQLNLCETPTRDLTALAELTTLQWLNLQSTQIDDGQLRHLAGLAGLTCLMLDDTQITDAGLAHLAKLERLEYLWLTNTKITDEGLSNLLGLGSLKQLDVGRTKVTEAGARMFQQSLPNCAVKFDSPSRASKGLK